MLQNEEFSDEKLLGLACDAQHAVFNLYITGYRDGVSGSELRYILGLPFSDNADPFGPACITPHNVSECITAASFEIAQNDLRRDWQDFLGRYSRYRTVQHGGHSPFPTNILQEICEQLCFTVYGSSAHSVGFRELIQDFCVDSTLLMTKFLECANSEGLRGEVENVVEGLELFYLPLIQQYRKEGLFDMSDALMAFCLFAVAKRHNGNLEPFDNLYTELETAVSRPRSVLTRKSIELARDIAEENHQEVTNNKLSQFIWTDQGEIERHIRDGEAKDREFKSTLRWDIKKQCIDEDIITHQVMKTLAAFLNTEGGVLLVGISDDGTVVGIKNDYDNKNPNADKLSLWFKDKVKHYMGNSVLDIINYRIVRFRNEEILFVECQPSDQPTFLRAKKNEEFYVRRGPSSESLGLSQCAEYVTKRWPRS